MNVMRQRQRRSERREDSGTFEGSPTFRMFRISHGRRSLVEKMMWALRTCSDCGIRVRMVA